MGNFYRVDIVVSDLEKSLTFYRDILGMKVTVDKELSQKVVPFFGVPNARCRLIRLKDEKSKEDNLALIYFLSPPTKPREQVKNLTSARDILFLYHTSEPLEIIDKRFKEAGVKVIHRAFREEGLIRES